MRTSVHSSMASRLSSRFRLLALALEKGDFWGLNGESATCERLAALAESDFPTRLRERGAELRTMSDLSSRNEIAASEEFFRVLNAVRQCIYQSRELGHKDKNGLGEELDEIQRVMEPTLQHDEGILEYRNVRKAWRTLAPYEKDPLLQAPHPGAQIAHYAQSAGAKAAQFLVAQLMHATQTIPILCIVCSRTALRGQRYCRKHNPSAPGKHGYERSWRVWRAIGGPYTDRNTILRLPEQRWRTNASLLLNAAPLSSRDWQKVFYGELKNQLGAGWRGHAFMAQIEFPERIVSQEKFVRELLGSLDDIDAFAKHARYLARKLVELALYAEADIAVRRWTGLTFEKVRNCLEQHGGSTRRVAEELGISQRRVQIILKKGAASVVN